VDDTELVKDARVGTRPWDDPGARARALDADEAVTLLFETHYGHLVRLAALLTRDPDRGEELVQDAFVDMHQRWSRLQEPAKAVAYLRTAVVNRARSDLRHRRVVLSNAPSAPDHAESAELGAVASVQQQELLRLLNALPDRQRSVLILRYYGELSEAEIASTLGISRGAVKSHSSRGLRALRPSLESRT
jgi:RNA polymerase sigma-70 factor (sigma-E family)